MLYLKEYYSDVYYYRMVEYDPVNFNFSKFTDSEFVFIEGIFGRSFSVYGYIPYYRNEFSIVVVGSGFKVMIDKLVDEWYVVKCRHCYKCDQLDGLKMCLEEVIESIK
jgi:hypothetical protein